jgi:DNA-binding response OmpR family regulator
MTHEKHYRLARLSNQLAELLMAVAICAEEIRSTLQADLEGGDGNWRGRSESFVASPTAARPILDLSTLCVQWNGTAIHLGNTLAFRLLERLARRPNQYVTHLDLIRDVWDVDNKATSTVRSVVRHLRVRLREGGMEQLADAIQGHNGRYILSL